MKLRAGVLMTLLAALSMAAWAGDIEGKVTGMKGKSVVYVDAIAGKTFPAPKDHPVMDQKGLMFSPHILTVQQGTTVDSRTATPCNTMLFGPRSAVIRKRGTISEPGPKVKSVLSRLLRRGWCRCCATYIRK